MSSMDAKVVSFYRNIYADLTVDHEEAAELNAFLAGLNPPPDKLMWMRATAFRIASEFLSDDKDKNVSLLRTVNYIVHAIEANCLQPLALAGAAAYLWKLDANRLDPHQDYTINVQQGKKPYWKEDKADDPLFSYVDRRALHRPTYSAFVALLDNYSAETGVAEVITNQERTEVKRFLRVIMETQPMQFCHHFCRSKKPDLVPADRDGFIRLLQKIWFDLYRRAGTRDSSGFEHVFVGEIKDGKISGFHNWIQLYLEEKSGNLDYRGYIKPRSHGEAQTDDDDQLLTIQFTWKGVEKSVGSSFIGTSPEFEFALYTMCFLVGEEENDVTISTETDTFDVTIKCYRMARDKVGTSFPEIKSHYD